MSGKRLSIVVPVRNGAGTLPALLDRLARQADPEETEVLIVDDDSTDETGNVVARYDAFRYLRLSSHHGPPAALNIGIEAAGAPIVALTDADCIPADDWIAAGLAAFDRDPDLGVLVGEVRIDLSRPTAAGLADAATFLDQERFTREGHFATANVWFRRKALAAAGRFDDGIEWHGFDTEYGLRLTRTGFPPHFAPEVLVVHPPRSTLRALATKARRVGRGRAQIGAQPLAPSPRALLPRRLVPGKARLAELGVELGPARELQVALTQYFAIYLPMLLAETSELRRRRRAARLEPVR